MLSLREMDIMVDLIHRTRPVSKAPYRITLVEMEELKKKLKELLNKDYIIWRKSSWGAGAAILFFRNKVNTIRFCID